MVVCAPASSSMSPWGMPPAPAPFRKTACGAALHGLLLLRVLRDSAFAGLCCVSCMATRISVLPPQTLEADH
jgi:hypothetical protein